MDAKFFHPGIYEFVVFVTKTRDEKQVRDLQFNKIPMLGGGSRHPTYSGWVLDFFADP